MYTIAIASVALMATAVSAGAGKAIVINGCKNDIHVCNVPAADGGYEEIDTILSYNGNYNQTFTELTNGMGWSIKLSPTADLSNILQFEYTYHNDGTIWYDLSAVNGNPWDGNWEITATGGDGCKPRQAAYRYSTDDAYGMQDCAEDANITVLLCSGEEQNDGAASSASASMSASATAETSAAPTLTSYASSSAVEITTSSEVESSSSSATEAAQSYSGWSHNWNFNQVEESSASASLTTFATQTVTPAPGVTVTEVATAVVTEVVTMTHYADGKRDEHAHQHMRRHPHARD